MSTVYYDSYADKEELDDCINRLHRKLHEESSNTMNDDVFTVTDIEQAIR